MIRPLIAATGKVLNRLPESCGRGLAYTLGYLLYLLRRTTLLTNLYYAFPEKPEQWRKKIALESSRRLMETALFVAVSPYWDKETVRKRLTITDRLAQMIEDSKKEQVPCVIFIPHFRLMEAVAMLPALHEPGVPDCAVIYRPLKSPELERWVVASRERFGIRMFSRKQGLIESRHTLKRGGKVALLFDQNAGRTGALGLFMGRLASFSTMGGTMAAKENARMVVIYPRYTGYLKAELDCEPLESVNDATDITLASNDWLENKLRMEEDCAADWLWHHNRWKTQDEHHSRFQLKYKRSLLEHQVEFLQPPEIPRRTKVLVRMPNWLGDVLMALPLLRAMREGRPDFHFTLLAKSHLCSLLEHLDIADEVRPLPTEKGLAYFRSFYAMRRDYFQTAVLFTNSDRGDMEAWLTRTPQRFGMLRSGKWRPLLTDAWSVPEDLDETQLHQTAVWEQMMQHFGLREKQQSQPLDKKKFASYLPEPIANLAQQPLGLICGTENNPAKRWPVSRWRSLIRQLLEKVPTQPILLLGTGNDAAITQQVAADFDPAKVIDLAGKTDLLAFAATLSACRVVVCNDTGGMHLANAVGVPVVGVFGPTNPVRTGPIYEAPVRIVQPIGCPATGGMPIDKVSATDVLKQLETFL